MTQKQVEKNKKDTRRTTRSDLARKSQELALSSQDIKVPPPPLTGLFKYSVHFKLIHGIINIESLNFVSINTEVDKR